MFYDESRFNFWMRWVIGSAFHQKEAIILADQDKDDPSGNQQ